MSLIMKWHAVYTKPRNEDVVSLRLKDAGIDVLNPKIKSKRFRRNRLTENTEPFFPCYLFANFDRDKHFHLISYTRGVRYILGKGNPIVLPDEIINTIKERMGDSNIVVIRQILEKGDRVLITDGHLKDFCGIFEREIRGSERVMILLNTINCRVEVDSWLLRKI